MLQRRLLQILAFSKGTNFLFTSFSFTAILIKKLKYLKKGYHAPIAGVYFLTQKSHKKKITLPCDVKTFLYFSPSQFIRLSFYTIFQITIVQANGQTKEITLLEIVKDVKMQLLSQSNNFPNLPVLLKHFKLYQEAQHQFEIIRPQEEPQTGKCASLFTFPYAA